jgi:hypothetical protein
MTAVINQDLAKQTKHIHVCESLILEYALEQLA